MEEGWIAASHRISPVPVGEDWCRQWGKAQLALNRYREGCELAWVRSDLRNLKNWLVIKWPCHPSVGTRVLHALGRFVAGTSFFSKCEIYRSLLFFFSFSLLPCLLSSPAFHFLFLYPASPSLFFPPHTQKCASVFQPVQLSCTTDVLLTSPVLSEASWDALQTLEWLRCKKLGRSWEASLLPVPSTRTSCLFALQAVAAIAPQPLSSEAQLV